jgi:hypothetical protein
VGAIRTQAGLILNGFELTFMRVERDHLNAADTYKSSWLGDDKGGGPGWVTSEGKLVVGINGRSGKEVSALGIVILK